MKYILGKDTIDVVAQFAASQVLLAFDFDGTLAPIVSDRDTANIRTKTKALLAQVSHRYPCAVISGRSCEDLLPRLDGISLRHVIGNHGLEPGGRLHEFFDEISIVLPQLEAKLQSIVGVDIENKIYSLAIHYRKSRKKRFARSLIYAAVDTLLPKMRIIPGKLVVNVIPARAPHKGDALIRIRSHEMADTSLYVGDDATDEDVFQLDQPGQLLSVRIGRKESSAAQFYLRDQRDMDRLLQQLLALRGPSP